MHDVHSTEGSREGQNWVDFWNRPNAIYANRRNLETHFACLQQDLDAYLPTDGTVLDFGCGDALAAEAMAARCRTVYLFDAAPAVQQRLRARFPGHPRIKVLSEEELAALPSGSVDMVLAVSVLQYIPRQAVGDVLNRWRDLLSRQGRILIADVVDPRTPMLRDVASQLSMARKHGFLMAALLGLGATIITDRRWIAADEFFTGLFETALEEGEMITAVTFEAPEKAGYAKFANPASRYALAGVFVAKRAEGARVAVTGAGANGVFRHGGMEEALASSWSPDAVAASEVSPRDMLADMHASAEYRANLVRVMARRAVLAAG